MQACRPHITCHESIGETNAVPSETSCQLFPDPLQFTCQPWCNSVKSTGSSAPWPAKL